LSEKFEEIENDLIEFLTENLSISVEEEGYGFNGKHLSIKLQLNNKVISEGWHDIKRDDG
jgi:hypothetical protein